MSLGSSTSEDVFGNGHAIDLVLHLPFMTMYPERVCTRARDFCGYSLREGPDRLKLFYM